MLTTLLNLQGLNSLLRDYRVHARLLIAVPALLFGELLMEARFRAVMAHIRQARLLQAPDLEYMDGVIATLVRLRDSYLPELAVLVLLIIHTAVTYKGLVDPTPWLARGSGNSLQLSVAGWYAVLVSAPIFQFLLGLSLWKWLLWAILRSSCRNAICSWSLRIRINAEASGSSASPGGLRAHHFCRRGGNWSNLAIRHPLSRRPLEEFHAANHRPRSDRRFRRTWPIGLFCSPFVGIAPQRNSGIRDTRTVA